MKREVVITGIGILSPIGNGRGEFWHNCLAGTAAVETIPEQWRDYNSYSSPIWAPMHEPDYTQYPLSRAEKMQMDPVQLFTLISADMAVADAGFTKELRDEKKNTYILPEVHPDRCGVVMGTGNGGLVSYTGSAATHIVTPIKKTVDAYCKKMAGSDSSSDTPGPFRFSSRFNPFSVAMTMPNACSAVLSIKYSFPGLSMTVSSACASGTTAIGTAFRAIRTGDIDMALTGGAEYLADPYGGIFRAFDTAKTLVQADGNFDRANRPFDKKRSGFLFSGGGAAVLVLEEAEHARRRGKQPVAAIESYSETCDAFTIMGMDPDGRQIDKMYSTLFTNAACEPEDIAYINTHGTGTIINDETESRIIEKVFGKKPLVNATKSLTGHTIGASGALETAVTALSIQDQFVHPCANLDDPIRELNFVTDARQEHEIEWALNQSFGFGGHIAGLILKKPALP